MNKFDFWKLKSKYLILTDSDINFLNDFFNKEEILEKFKELELIRKKMLKMIYILIFIYDIISIVYFLFFLRATDLFSIIGFILISDIIIFIITTLFYKNIPKEIKTNIIPKLASNISQNLKYDSEDKYSFDESILVDNSLLNSYDRLDLKEDSIEYIYNFINNNKNENIWFIINSYKFKTSEKYNDKQWKEQYKTNNYSYLTKISFKNPLHKVENSIILKTDKTDNFLKKIAIVLLIYLISWTFIISVVASIIQDSFKKFFDSIWVNPFLPILFFMIFLYILCYYFYERYINTKRVKLENIDFEKKFDVYCKDQIESRKILTSDFMYRILDFSNKINKVRKYEFYFYWSEIYIVRDLMWYWSFMEISVFKNLIANVEQLIEFYIELKNASNLAKDLWLYYFDKTTYSKEIIKDIK